MDDGLTAREQRLYARLFALANEQRIAATRLDMGRLGFWGRMRLKRRHQRLESLFHTIVASKLARQSGVDLHDAIWRDINHCAGHWPWLSADSIALVRQLARRARGFVTPSPEMQSVTGGGDARSATAKSKREKARPAS